MPRKILLRTDQNPYHINGRSNNKDWFVPDINICFNIFLEVIKKTQEMYFFEFHHFILMDNHFHMIISTPRSNIDLGMRYFMTECSRKIARASNRINKIFGRRYHWTSISDSIQYAHTVKYLYRNPVEASMTNLCEKYIYSSIQGNQKLFTENIQGFDQYLPKNIFEFREWINEEYPDEVKDSIKKALEKKIFKISKSRITNQKVDLKKYLKNSK